MPSAFPCSARCRQHSGKFFSAAAGAIFLPFIATAAEFALPQREQAERSRIPDFSSVKPGEQRKLETDAGTVTQDDAFGAQIILKDRMRQRDFQVFGEVAAFHTSNIALARSNVHGDSFLNATAGLGWRRALNSRLSLAVSGRYSIFRYGRYGSMDFQSADADVTFGIRLPAHWELALGYGFTQLNSRTGASEFYHEHAINAGLQRVFALSPSHYLIAGIGPSWSWAEPRSAQRDKYTAYLGWQWNAGDHFSTTLLYRYGYYVYREGGTGRRDHNQTISLTLRYDVTQWLALTASGFAAWNRSNQPAFDYDAWNLGGGIGLNARF